MQKKSLIFLIITLFSTVIFAGNPIWECEIQDASQHVWKAKSTFQRKAYTNVLDACKKQSADPLSCTRKSIDCEAFLNGISTTSLWKCKALDANAQAYPGSLLSDKERAALSAQANCKEHSSIPDTCYVYLFTCINQNERLS